MLKHYLGFKVVKVLRERITLRLKKFSLSFYTRERLGEISSIVHKDVDAMELVVAHIWTRMFAGITVSFVLGILFFLADWRMGLALISLIPFAFLFLILGTRRNSEGYRRNQNIMVTMLSRFLEYTRGLPVLKTFRKNRDFEDKLDESVRDYSRSSADIARSISFVT
ncbi:MAG: ABC transporter ATP-binding protein, partial [Proteobacteria bacterium]|nr:ABC transporter ATP-binding protein [Pseudomonadota bacterium]